MFKTVRSGNPDLHLIWWHGWGQSHTSLLPLAELFDGQATQHMYDLPGFGKSPQLSEDAGVQDYADAMQADIDALSGKKVIIGHSFGCRMAIRYAAKNPKGVDALILIAGAGIPRDRSFGWKMRSLSLKFLGKLARASDSLFGTKYRAAYSERFGSADYKNAGALRTTFVKTVNDNVEALCANVGIPVLLIYGDEDTETPVEIGEKFDRALPKSILKVIKGFGHLDILSRGRNKVEPLIRRFLNHYEIGVL